MITLDPFYSVAEYLKAVDAMKFNGVDYWEYIDIRYKTWYLDIDNAVTHKCLECVMDKYLVPKVRPLDARDEAFLERKSGETELSRYLDNDCLRELKQYVLGYAYAFLISPSEVLNLSLQTNVKIWWFGKYSNGLGLCVSTAPPATCYKVTEVPLKTGKFDIEIRKSLLDYRGYVRKYSKQPYFLNGQFYGYKGRKMFQY